jgi:hypothetical protein
VVVHADHDECGLRSNLRQVRDRVQAGSPQHSVLDDDNRRRQPLEQPHQVREIGGRGNRLDSKLVLEQPPEAGSYALAARGDENRDR